MYSNWDQTVLFSWVTVLRQSFDCHFTHFVSARFPRKKQAPEMNIFYYELTAKRDDCLRFSFSTAMWFSTRILTSLSLILTLIVHETDNMFIVHWPVPSFLTPSQSYRHFSPTFLLSTVSFVPSFYLKFLPHIRHEALLLLTDLVPRYFIILVF